jgi:hypothetical protein
MRELAERFFEHSARIDQVILLAALADSPDSDAFENFINLSDGGDLVRLFGMSNAQEQELLESEDTDGLWDWCEEHSKLGYLVKFATPAMRPMKSGGFVGSWGSYYTHWVYADTMDQALEAGFAWVAERRAAEQAKQPA